MSFENLRPVDFLDIPSTRVDVVLNGKLLVQ